MRNNDGASGVPSAALQDVVEVGQVQADNGNPELLKTLALIHDHLESSIKSRASS